MIYWYLEREKTSRMRSEGKTLASIGGIYGTSRQRIFQILNSQPPAKYKPCNFSNLEEYLQFNTCKDFERGGMLRKFILTECCEECGSTRNLHIHHLKYPARMSKNLQVLCASCHHSKHRKNMTHLRRGELYRDYLSGVSRKQLKQIYGISQSVVSKVIVSVREGNEVYRRI